MELITSDKNSTELNKLRSHLVTEMDATAQISYYSIIGTETQRIAIEFSENLDDSDRTDLRKLLESVKDEHFLYRGYELPIKQLKRMNNCYKEIQKYGSVFFYHPDDIPDELILFAQSFVELFVYPHEELDVDAGLVKHTLGLRVLGVADVTLSHYGGRMYIDDEHHMMATELRQYVYQKMSVSVRDIYCDIEGPRDTYNLEQVRRGLPPFTAVDNFDEYKKFKLLMTFCRLCQEGNHPMLTPIDIHELFDSEVGYNYFTLAFGGKIEEVSEEYEMNYYKEHVYTNLEEALTFSIYLSGFNLKHIIFENRVLESFTVCYSHDRLLEPHPDYLTMKNRVTETYHEISGATVDHIHNRNFFDMDLQTLLHCFVDKDSIVFADYNAQHINPVTGYPLPVHYYDCIKYRSDGLYTIYPLVKGFFDHCPLFDRTDLVVKDTSINIKNDKVIVHGVHVATMEFEDQERIIEHLHICWEKGYFLSTLGLMYYIETGEISKCCIKCPVWFSFNNSNENNMYRFLEFNNL
jgi:hypothetical protein